MQLAEIPRVKAGTTAKLPTRDLAEMDQDRLALATRAADLLGYHGLTADVTGQTAVITKQGKLSETLRTLDIEVLDTATVIDYQLDEVRRLTREHILEDNFDDWTTGYFSAAQWQHTKLAEYARPVPEFVLEKAVRIKEALPQVEFYIQHLSDPKSDPFLIAAIGKEIYYIEAWDEPRFEGRLTR